MRPSVSFSSSPLKEEDTQQEVDQSGAGSTLRAVVTPPVSSFSLKDDESDLLLHTHTHTLGLLTCLLRDSGGRLSPPLPELGLLDVSSRLVDVFPSLRNVQRY